MAAPFGRPRTPHGGAGDRHGVSWPSPGRVKTISGTWQLGEVRSRKRTASPRSLGPDHLLAGIWPWTNSVIAVSTKPGASAVHWMPSLPASRWVDWVKLITAALVAA